MDFPYWIKVKNFNWTIEQGTELEIEKGSGIKSIKVYVDGNENEVKSLIPGDYTIGLIGINSKGVACCESFYGIKVVTPVEKEPVNPTQFDKVIVLEIGQNCRKNIQAVRL